MTLELAQAKLTDAAIEAASVCIQETTCGNTDCGRTVADAATEEAWRVLAVQIRRLHLSAVDPEHDYRLPSAVHVLWLASEIETALEAAGIA